MLAEGQRTGAAHKKPMEAAHCNSRQAGVLLHKYLAKLKSVSKYKRNCELNDKHINDFVYVLWKY